MKLLGHTAAILCVLLLCQSERANGSNGVTVAGTVIAAGGTVDGADIKFEGVDEAQTVRTGPNGTYAISLPPGQYTATIEYRSMCNERRARFNVGPGPAIELNFYPWVCPSGSSWEYHESTLDSYPPEKLQPWIVYGKREVVGKTQTYSGPVMIKPFPVALSYNLMSLEAGRVTYTDDEYSVTATGNVVIRDKNGERKADKVKVLFNKDAAIVTIEH